MPHSDWIKLTDLGKLVKTPEQKESTVKCKYCRKTVPFSQAQGNFKDGFWCGC